MSVQRRAPGMGGGANRKKDSAYSKIGGNEIRGRQDRWKESPAKGNPLTLER